MALEFCYLTHLGCISDKPPLAVWLFGHPRRSICRAHGQCRLWGQYSPPHTYLKVMDIAAGGNIRPPPSRYTVGVDPESAAGGGGPGHASAICTATCTASQVPSSRHLQPQVWRIRSEARGAAPGAGAVQAGWALSPARLFRRYGAVSSRYGTARLPSHGPKAVVPGSLSAWRPGLVITRR